MASQRTTTCETQIGGYRFEILRISFDVVRESGGFQRLAHTSRPEYRFNGKRVSRAVFFTMKEAAKLEAAL